MTIRCGALLVGAAVLRGRRAADGLLCGCVKKDRFLWSRAVWWWLARSSLCACALAATVHANETPDSDRGGDHGVRRVIPWATAACSQTWRERSTLPRPLRRAQLQATPRLQLIFVSYNRHSFRMLATRAARVPSLLEPL
jgi:hypothetical protein